MPKKNNNKLLKLENHLAVLIYGLANAVLRILEILLGCFRRNLPPRTILVFRTGNLGDTVCAIPSYRALKKHFPNAQFLLLTSRDRVFNERQPLTSLIGNETFEEIIYYEPKDVRSIRKLWRLLGCLRSRHIDLIIYFGQYGVPFWRLLRDIFFFGALNCRSLIGFRLNKHCLFKIAQRYYRRFDCETERLINILLPLGISNEGLDFALPIQEIDKEIVNRLWPHKEIVEGRRVIGIHPGSSLSLKCWPRESFLSLAKELKTRYNVFIILLAGEDNNNICLGISNILAGDCLNLCGKTNFMQTAEVIKRCNVLISCDSGPVHLSAAVGVPTIIISSAWDYPGCWLPYGKHHSILRHDVPCQVCLKTECLTGRCVKDITVEEVVEVFRKTILFN